MGFLDKVTKSAAGVGSSVAKAAGKLGSNAVTASNEQSELVSLRSQVNVINQELDSAYVQVGRKFVEYVIASGEMPGVDVSDIMKQIDPKLTKKQELENQIVQLEKEIKQKKILREKQAAEEKFLAEKTKLDKALAMDVLTQEEYDEKIASARKRVDNFEEIRRVEQQEKMGLITAEEKTAKIKALTE